MSPIKLQPVNVVFFVWSSFFDTLKQFLVMGKKPKEPLFFPFMFACLYSCFSLLSFSLLGLQYRNQSSVPPTHKTNPCYCNCVICFSFMIVGLFLSKPTTNKHRKWKREEQFLSFTFLILCSYEIT